MSKTVKERKEAQVVTLSSIETEEDDRMLTTIAELDRVLGGGIVKGSLVLVGGLQAGHCPSHFVSSCPQFWQKYTLFFAFAISSLLVSPVRLCCVSKKGLQQRSPL